MGLVSSVDYPNKRIYLSVETADAILDTMDVYKEVRALRATNETHRQFQPIIIGGGNVQKIAGVSYTQPYVQLLHGCRIVPYNVTHELTVVRDTFTDDGFAGRGCFDRTPLSPTVTVDINFEVDKVELRVITNQSDANLVADTVWQHASASSMLTDMAFVKGIEGGRWVIVENQMVFFAADNLTEIARFNLFDSVGTPTMVNPVERVRV